MTSSPPTLPEPVLWARYAFCEGTQLKFIQVATPVWHSMVYSLKSALTEKISAYLDTLLLLKQA